MIRESQDERVSSHLKCYELSSGWADRELGQRCPVQPSSPSSLLEGDSRLHSDFR